MELGMISSTWLGTKVSRLDGIRTAKEIGFDTYDIFEDPLDLTDEEREEIKQTCEEVGLPIRSVVCVAFGIVDFNPSVQRFTLDRIKAYVDQGAYLGARNVLLVVGEYYWDCEVFPQEAIWDMAKEMVKEAGEYAQSKGLEIVLELEPFDEALLKDVHELVAVRERDRPPGRPRERGHLAPAPVGRVVRRRQGADGLIGHIHLSDCDGKVHGDLPAGMGVTPIKEYLAAIRDTGYDGTVSIELEYSPDPEKIVEWAQQAYDGTAAIMRDLGVRELGAAMADFDLNTGPDLPPKTDYGIGCIGAGFIMRDIHLPAYDEAGFRPVAIASRTPDHAGAAAEQNGAEGLRHLAGAARRPRRRDRRRRLSRPTSSSRSSARRRAGRTSRGSWRRSPSRSRSRRRSRW